MQKPILLGVDGQAREIVEKYNAGLHFEPENEEAFIDAILKMRNNEALMANFKAGGVKLARAFEREILANKMLSILFELCCSVNSIYDKR